MSDALFMDAIRDEMASTTDRYARMLGEMMSEFLRLHPELRRAPEGKSLKSAMGALKATARKKAQNGAYAMPPQEAFDLLMEHYGVEPGPEDFGVCMAAILGLRAAPNVATPAPVTQTPAADPFDLDALLGE